MAAIFDKLRLSPPSRERGAGHVFSTSRCDGWDTAAGERWHSNLGSALTRLRTPPMQHMMWPDGAMQDSLDGDASLHQLDWHHQPSGSSFPSSSSSPSPSSSSSSSFSSSTTPTPTTTTTTTTTATTSCLSLSLSPSPSPSPSLFSLPPSLPLSLIHSTQPSSSG
jgi:hypothetical protein